ncbi:fatty-acyl-CoA synthase [Breoghania corrubedonensis]|uniref:Fatty-acyl-CoA synthase n=1 Tax=Breoghania corrubedonensis TaxID=665038 RepID=A0A2T5US72_9HYPH|nr:long-chain-fatty-acid--CoA ligase [Breoghania corrubedonensis]PTW54348.1 fatty-acyl-CoA synthase [Breoghania corrubedonensis]
MFDRHMGIWPSGIPHHIEVPERNLSENLRLTAEAQPDKVAIHYHGVDITFAELHTAVLRIAGWLQHGAGVAKGDRVLLFMQNSPHFIIGYYAILRANAVVVPVNPMNREHELDHLIRDTGARVALTGQELLEHIAHFLREKLLDRVLVAAYADKAGRAPDIPLPAGLECRGRDDYGLPGAIGWPVAEAMRLSPGPLATGADDLAVIPYSSGTTGQQKGCMHSHRTVMTTCVGGIVWNPQGTGFPSLSVLPLFHVTGMQASMNCPILTGDTIVLMTRWDRRVAAKLIKRHGIARWRCITTMVIDLLNDPEIDASDLSSLRVVGGGGAAMPAPIAKRLKELTGLDYIEGYGMSETIAATHINPVDRPRRQCLGIPVFDVDSRIIDPETGDELGVGDVGEIIVSAPQVFLGYWNKPEATKAAFIELDGKPFLRTGDIGRYDEEGYFYIVDRMKRMINASGFKVWPTEVEAILHDHPAIAEICVVGYRDIRRGESVMAYVVLREEVSEEDLIAWCRKEMAVYKVPRKVVFVDTLPRNASGKLQWKQLAEQAQETFGEVG